jgi:hypothetical protein
LGFLEPDLDLIGKRADMAILTGPPFALLYSLQSGENQAPPTGRSRVADAGQSERISWQKCSVVGWLAL